MNQWRSRSFGAFIAMSLFFAFTLGAQDASTEKAVAYLVSEQDEEGGWNQNKQKRIVDSLESFRALQRVNGGETALNNALKYFSTLPEDSNVTLSVKLQILSNSTADITSLATKLISLQKADGGWGLVESKRGSVPHTLFAVNALLSANKDNKNEINSGVEFLIRQQQLNGSWIFSGEHSLSDTAHTAMVLQILKNVQNTNTFAGSGLEQAIAKAQQYIQGKSNSNGSYGDLLDTAWVYLALSQIKQPSELQTTLNFISNSQKSNGSWNDKIYDTAICLQALTAIQVPQSDLPDLEITEQNISFNPNAPLTGNEVTVSATIFNTGKLDAENVKVEFFNQDPRLGGTPLGTAQTILLIPSGGSAIAHTKFSTAEMVGAEQIVVFVDRDNNINEITKTNNAAAKILTIGGMPDLAVFADDITLSNPNPKAFETVDLIVTIHNNGNEAVQNIPIKIYDNDQLLSEFILSGVNAGSTNKGIITTGFSAENHTIRVAVDPDHTIASEINLANNSASKLFTVDAEPEKPADIAVESLTTTPSVPLSIEPTTITVNLANLGGVDITTAFNVVLSVDGTAVGTITVPQLLKGQRASLSFENLTLAAGERTITATADGANAVTEDTNRANNTLTKTISVQDSSTPANLEVVSFTATPSTATVGGTILFKLSVKNTGTQVANNVNVALWNGSSSIANARIPSLAGGRTGELQFEYAFSSNGNYTIRAVATCDGKTAEKNTAVNITGASDLEITTSGIVLSPTSVTAFQQFEITAAIRNIGNMDAVNIPVRFLANGEVLATLNLSGVSAGGSNRAVLRTSLPKGTYNITVALDPERTLANEHNLTNNTAYKTFNVAAPLTTQADLAVSDLLIDPALPIQNTSANLTATVVNLGGTDVLSAFTVEFKDGSNILHTFTVPSLAAGQKAKLNLAVNLTEGNHTLVVTADPANAITEETKANNSLSKEVAVATDATPADLTVASVTLDKEAPNVQDKIVVTAAIYNAGTSSAENFFVRVMVNGTALGEDYKITLLPGGGTFNLQIPYTVVKEGENTIQVIADAQNNIEESDETNNSGSATFTAAKIARPDLTIPDGGLAASPENPQPSVAFEYRITVANIGDENAPTSRLIVSEGNPQMAGATRLAEAVIPAIEAGKQAIVSANLKLDANKENIFIFLDSDDEIAESNENNNLFQTGIAVSNRPDLMVDANSISLSHTDLTKGKIVELKAVISNIGTADATAVKGRFIDQRVGGTNTLIAEVAIPAVAAGENIEIQSAWSATGGVHTIVFEVDYENVLQEATKSNNTAQKDVNMLVPETSLRILKKNENSELVVNNRFGANETVYFEVLHGYPNATLSGVIEDFDKNLYRAVVQNGMLTFNTSYSAPGAYTGIFAVVDKDTGVVLDEIQGTFEVQPTKLLKNITASPSPKHATVDENVVLKMMSEVVNGSNQAIPGTLTFSLTAPSGAKAFEDKVHEVVIQPYHTYFRYTHPEFAFTFTEVGNYTLTTTLVTELGTLTNSATIPVYETPPASLTPAKLDMSLPLGEQIMQQIKMVRDGTASGEMYDVVFMFDTTGSYGSLVYQFGEQSQSIMAAIKEQLGENVQFGIASFADYPFHGWGDYNDYAYRIDHPLTSNTQAIRDTFANSNWWYGGNDGPESTLEALYQLATGEGRDVDKNGSYEDHGDIKPASIGWRPGSTRIVFLGTDIDFHRGGEPAYGDGEPQDWWEKPYYYPGPTWEETTKALMDNGITVVGLVPGDITDVRNLLVDIGSVHRNGDPLTFTFDYSGAQITSEVLSAVELSASALRFTVRAVGDEKGFFTGTEPERITIYPGEEASFELKFEGKVEPGVVDQIYTFELELVAGGGRVIGRIPISILVPQKTPLKVSTDKPQYVIGETTKVTVNLEMTANAMKTVSGVDDLKKGTFDRTTATDEPGNIVLSIAGMSAPKEQIKYGDAEIYDDWWNYWKTTSSYDGNGEIYMWGEPSTYEPLSGSMSTYLYGNYYTYSETQTVAGDATFYQQLTIPGDALGATLRWKDRGRSGGTGYKVQIRDKENKVLRTLFVGNSDTWEPMTHEFDVKEYLGKEIRVAFVFDPANRGSYGSIEVQVDDVSLGLTYPGYYTTGTANLIIDAEAPVMWDKLMFEADTTPEGTRVQVRYRTADGLGNLEEAEFGSITDSKEVKITSDPCRYLEVQFILNTLDDQKTPKVKKLHATYVKYSAADNARLKVSIEDKDGNHVAALADFLPQLVLGLKQNFTYDFDTKNHEPGDYKAVGRLYINSELESMDDADFKLITDAIASLLESSITTDKLEYTGSETVQITSRVSNISNNANLTNLSVHVEIKDPNGTVVKTFDYVIDSLLKQSLNSKLLSFAVGNDMILGDYTVTQTVTMSGIDPLAKTAVFALKANVVQGKGITGTLTPQPLIVKRRIGDLSIQANATNTGNVDLSGVSFRVRIYDAAGQTVLKEFTGTGDLPKAGPAYAQTHPYGSKVDLMPGTYPMVLTAEFTYNGEAQVIPLDTRGFVVTNTPPVANAGADITTTTTSKTGIPVTLNGSGSTDENSTDEDKKNDIVSYEWKHGETVLGTGETLTTTLPAGVYSITLTVTDTCGAKHSDTVKVTITQILLPPTITDLNPVHNTITKELGLSAKATDEIWGIDWTTLVFKAGTTVLPASYDTTTGAITSSLPTDVADGWYDLNIYIKNQGGAGAMTPEWKVGLDRTPPVISDLAPEADVFTNNAKPTISATVTDAFAGVDPATVKVSIGSTVLESTYDVGTGKVTAVVPSDLADGWHDAKIEVADKVGNTANTTWRVGIDITPPTISNMIPVADSEINQASQEISATVTDALSGVKADTIVLKLDNVVVAHSYDTATGKVVFSAENLTSGIHAVNITVSDNAGNESNATWQFNVQLRVPGSEYLLFHNSQNGQLDISGGNKTINGMAHSHANIKVRGNNTTITGQTTAVGTISVNGSGHNIALQQSNAEAIPMPVYPYEYYVANATYTYNSGKTFGKGETIPNGIHLVNGDVTIQGDINGNVTIVATGSISVKSQTVNLTYADTKYKVALYSKEGNISFTSNGVTVKGVIYAPSGECKVASSTSSFTGAIVGNTVDISGQDMTLNPLDDGTENNGGAQ